MPGDFLDFGITDTSVLEGGKLLNDIFSDSSPNADPNDIQLIAAKEKEEKEKKEKEAREAAAKAAAAKKETPKPDKTEIEGSIFGDEKDKPEGEGEPEKKEQPTDTDEPESDNQFEILSKELYTLGIFSPDVDEEGNEVSMVAKTPEEMKSLFETQVDRKLDRRLNNFLVNKHGEEGVRIFESIFVNGVDPKEYFNTYTELQDLSQLKTDNDEDAEVIVREFNKNLPPDKLNKYINRLKDISELQNQAEDLLPQLIEQRQKTLDDKEAEAEAKTARQNKLDLDYRNSLTKILQDKTKEKEFDGLPLSEQSAREAFDFLYNKKWQLPNGEKITDFDVFILESKKPENIAQRVKIALLAKSGFDFSKITKKVQSATASKYFQSFAEKKTAPKKNPSAEKESAWPL